MIRTRCGSLGVSATERPHCTSLSSSCEKQTCNFFHTWLTLISLLYSSTPPTLTPAPLHPTSFKRNEDRSCMSRCGSGEIHECADVRPTGGSNEPYMYSCLFIQHEFLRWVKSCYSVGLLTIITLWIFILSDCGLVISSALSMITF